MKKKLLLSLISLMAFAGLFSQELQNLQGAVRDLAGN